MTENKPSQALMVIPQPETTFSFSTLNNVPTAPPDSRLTAFSHLTANIGLLQEYMYQREATPMKPDGKLVFSTTVKGANGIQEIEKLVIRNDAAPRVVDKWKHMAAGLYYELAQSPHTKKAADKIAVRRREEQSEREKRFSPSTEIVLTEAQTIINGVKAQHDAREQWKQSMQDLWNRPARTEFDHSK